MDILEAIARSVVAHIGEVRHHLPTVYPNSNHQWYIEYASSRPGYTTSCVMINVLDDRIVVCGSEIFACDYDDPDMLDKVEKAVREELYNSDGQ